MAESEALSVEERLRVDSLRKFLEGAHERREHQTLITTASLDKLAALIDRLVADNLRLRAAAGRSLSPAPLTEEERGAVEWLDNTLPPRSLTKQGASRRTRIVVDVVLRLTYHPAPSPEGADR